MAAIYSNRISAWLFSALALTASCTSAQAQDCRFPDIARYGHGDDKVAGQYGELDLISYHFLDRKNDFRLDDCGTTLLFSGMLHYPRQSRSLWKEASGNAWQQGYGGDSYRADGMVMMAGCETHSCIAPRAELFFDASGLLVAAMATAIFEEKKPWATGDDFLMPVRSIRVIRSGADTPALRRFMAAALAHEEKTGDEIRLSLDDLTSGGTGPDR